MRRRAILSAAGYHGNAIAKIDSITDDFTSLDQNRWYTSGTTPPSVSSGRLNVPMLTGSSGGNGSRISSKKVFDLTNSSVFVQLYTRPSTSDPDARVGLWVDDMSSDNVRITWGGDGNWHFDTYINATDSNTTMPLTSDSFIRLRHSGTTLYFDTSPDGVAWTNRRSMVPGPTLNLSSVVIELRGHSSDGVGVSVFDNLNLAGTAPPDPDPEGMQPPAGSTLEHNMSALSAWAQYQGDNATVAQLSGPGPGGDVILRNTLVDGQRPDWDDVGNERSDLTGPDVPLNSVRWMIFYMRVVQMPDLSGGGHFMLGPHEIHGHALPQATVQPQIGTAAWHPPGSYGRHIFEANAGSASHDLYDVGPVDVGNWHQWKMGIYYTQSSSGWCELWRDGVKVYQKNGVTTGEANSGYWKFANYRGANINGPSIYEISGCRIYSA